MVKGSASGWGSVRSGVPLGTVLCPMLFLAYIMDINVGVESGVSCIADIRVTRIVSVVDDVHKLQSDLNRINDWAERNNMFNS